MDFAEKFKINSIWRFDQDTEKPKDAHHLKIGRRNGKYGIIDNEGNTLLQFEYDNITRISKEILQTCREGKLGIVLIESDYTEADYLMGIADTGRFSVAGEIECGYDSVILFDESLVLLVNYHHSGQEIRAYFSYANSLSERVYSGYSLVSSKEHLINMYSGGKCYLIDYWSGKVLKEKIEC